MHGFRILRIASIAGTVLIATWSCSGSSASSDQPAPPQPAKAAPAEVNPETALLNDFNARLKAYLDLRSKLDDTTPPLKQTNDQAKIDAAEDSLAIKISEARAAAKPGDIFTPEMRKQFRAWLRRETKGRLGADAKETVLDEPPKVPLVVNSVYPSKEPLTTVPATMLASLPRLPDTLEYRFVGKHLILRDTKANIIIDFIYNAIP